MIKALLFLCFFLTANQLKASNVEIKKKNGLLARGEFIGTYKGHVHILQDNSIEHFNCGEIESIFVVNTKDLLIYDCNKNSVSEEILFPPELDPMTGEWITVVPDVFNEKQLEEQKEKKKSTLKGLETRTGKQQDLLERSEKVFKESMVLSNEGLDDLMFEANEKVKNVQKKINNSFALLDPHDLNDDKNEPEKPAYLTKSEIQILIKEELQRHFYLEKKEKTKRKKNKELSLYERYKTGSITEKELNRIVNGRSPVELLEANLITQEEYNRKPKKITNPFTYIEKYGLTTTMTRKPEFIILPVFGAYVFLLVFFQ